MTHFALPPALAASEVELGSGVFIRHFASGARLRLPILIPMEPKHWGDPLDFCLHASLVEVIKHYNTLGRTMVLASAQTSPIRRQSQNFETCYARLQLYIYIIYILYTYTYTDIAIPSKIHPSGAKKKGKETSKTQHDRPNPIRTILGRQVPRNKRLLSWSLTRKSLPKGGLKQTCFSYTNESISRNHATHIYATRLDEVPALHGGRCHS